MLFSKTLTLRRCDGGERQGDTARRRQRLPRTSDVTISRVHAIRCVVHFELAASLLHSTRMNRVIKYQRIASRHRALLEASDEKELNYLPAKVTYFYCLDF